MTTEPIRATIREWSVYLGYDDDAATRWQVCRPPDSPPPGLWADTREEAAQLAREHGFEVID
jgi:hypothetical protein